MPVLLASNYRSVYLHVGHACLQVECKHSSYMATVQILSQYDASHDYVPVGQRMS